VKVRNPNPRRASCAFAVSGARGVSLRASRNGAGRVSRAPHLAFPGSKYPSADSPESHVFCPSIPVPSQQILTPFFLCEIFKD
jgi:hypothetical protein